MGCGEAEKLLWGVRLGDNGSQSVWGLGDPPCGLRSFKPGEMGFVPEGQTCSAETVALAARWGRDWGRPGRDGACRAPVSPTGPGPAGDTGLRKTSISGGPCGSCWFWKCTWSLSSSLKL